MHRGVDRADHLARRELAYEGPIVERVRALLTDDAETIGLRRASRKAPEGRFVTATGEAGYLSDATGRAMEVDILCDGGVHPDVRFEALLA